MRKSVKSALLGVICGSTALTGMPQEVLAGPMSVAAPAIVSLSAPATTVHYRRYYRPARWGYYRPVRYYRRAYYPRRYYRYGYGYYPAYGYGYDPSGALFATAALGLMGAGIAAATAPRWGYGGWGYGGWGGGWGWGGPGFGGWGYGPGWW